MATVDLITQGTVGHPARDYIKNVYVLTATVDVADAATEKGSAIVATDTIEIIQLPDDTIVLGGGLEVVTPTTSVTTTTSFDFGYSASVDCIADGVSLMTAGYGAAGTNGALNQARRFGSAESFDLYVATAPTAGISTGVVRAYLVVADIS